MFKETITYITIVVELGGVFIILLGMIFSLYIFLRAAKEKKRLCYGDLRKNLGRSILIGLEFFVAADIIDTVTVELNFHNVYLLGLIVLIRTFLSFSLEIELEGRLPWKTCNKE